MRYKISLLLLTLNSIAFAQTNFSSLQEVLNLAEKNSYTTLVATEQNKLASLTTVSAYGNALNPRIPVSANITDNTRLPVSFFPGQIFGQPEGTFKQVTMGQQYISVLNFSPQFDILNFGNISIIKSAKANEALANHNTLLTKKNLFDQVNACYHNIVSFQAQIKVLKQNQQKADSLLKIVGNKYAQGLVRKQDVNDAEINAISIKDKIEQASLSLEQQYLTLKTLLDTEENVSISQQLSTETVNSQLKSSGNINEENAKFQLAFSQAEYKSALWNNLPTLSFVTSFNWQNNSNAAFLDSKNPWINSNFWSLRLAWDFPTNVPKITALKSNLINFHIAEINAKHASLQTKLLNEQMDKDFEKSVAQYKNNLAIYQLKLDNYQKSNNQFQANILPLDKLLIAHNDLLVSEINVATSMAAIAFNKSKIEINNQVK